MKLVLNSALEKFSFKKIVIFESIFPDFFVESDDRNKATDFARLLFLWLLSHKKCDLLHNRFFQTQPAWYGCRSGVN